MVSFSLALSVSYVDVASSLEVLFLYPGVVSLTDEDAQGNVSISLEALLVVSGLVKCDTNLIVGVPQVAELGDLPNEVTDKVSNQTSKQATWIGGSTSASG